MGKDMLGFRISAHRGAPSEAPENTIPGFIIAMGLDVDFIELDVRASKDNVLVVIHDEFVDRTTNGHGRVSELYFDELRKLDAGSWFSERFCGTRIPTLKEALMLLSQCNKNIIVDIKVEGYEKKIVRMIDLFNIRDRVWIASHIWSVLARTRDLDNTIPLMAIIHEVNGTTLKLTSKLDISMLAPRLWDITYDNMNLFRKYGLLVNAGIINDPSLIPRYIDMGVDTISTDNPKLISEYRKTFWLSKQIKKPIS